MKKIILIICRGNIIRSPFAEMVILRELKKRKLCNRFKVISRGTQGTIIDPVPVRFPNITFYKNEFHFSKPTLGKFEIDITKHVSKPVTKEDAGRAAIIFAVDEKNKIALIKLFPEMKTKIHKLSELIGSDEDFADPEGAKEANRHKKTLTDIHDAIVNGFPKLLALAKNA